MDIINKRDNYQTPDMVWGINNPGPSGNQNLSVRRRGMEADFSQGLDEDVWTHIAITMDGANVTFYKNGVNIETVPYTYGEGYNSRIIIGAAANMDGSFRENDAFNGALDDVRFYSRKLTDAEILSIYQGTDVVAVEDWDSTVPSQYKLAQNFPNPFNPNTNIQFQIPRDGHVTISVYNLLGEQVATLVDRNMKSGMHHVTFDAAQFSSGIYFYKIQASDFTQVKKMMLMK
jgi:hypothetical protein